RTVSCLHSNRPRATSSQNIQRAIRSLSSTVFRTRSGRLAARSSWPTATFSSSSRARPDRLADQGPSVLTLGLDRSSLSGLGNQLSQLEERGRGVSNGRQRGVGANLLIADAQLALSPGELRRRIDPLGFAIDRLCFDDHQKLWVCAQDEREQATIDDAPLGLGIAKERLRQEPQLLPAEFLVRDRSRK